MPFRLLVLLLLVFGAAESLAATPVRVAIVGLTHDHVFWLLGRSRDLDDIEIVGVCEPNEALARERMGEAGLPISLYYASLATMLRETGPEAAVLFGSIREHEAATLACAKAGIHVMVEKPLATSLGAAKRMAHAAEQAGVHLLTNYETTWYPAVAEVGRRVSQGDHGRVRRMVFRMGHRGPIEIGCRQVFLDWLLDPVENGAGALADFGCYGVNLATAWRGGERPRTVSCVTQQLKPGLYPNVDDDATITLEYEDAVAVVQASWNWPHNVKEARVYSERGDLLTIGRDQVRVHPSEEAPVIVAAPALSGPGQADPFAHLAAVVRGETEPNELSSLANNLIVVEVLDAAKRSAEMGECLELGPSAR